QRPAAAIFGGRRSTNGRRFRLSTLGCRSWAIDFRSSAIDFRSSAIGFRSSAIGFRSSAIGFRSAAMRSRSQVLKTLPLAQKGALDKPEAAENEDETGRGANQARIPGRFLARHQENQWGHQKHDGDLPELNSQIITEQGFGHGRTGKVEF